MKHEALPPDYCRTNEHAIALHVEKSLALGIALRF